MKANELRQKFLNFFASKGHKILPSASLVPQGDPTLLLTSAGMVPFKPYFLGTAKPESTRVTTCQKCVRTGDIDKVGLTPRHGTFFEMLGNFSFGDYFKREAIPWAWEFVTEHLKIPKDRLWVSIYLDDDEAFDIWHRVVGLPAERIIRLGKDDNFWEIGVGPCGPCSEIHYDRGPEFGCGRETCAPGCDCNRFMEIWNLVFIQFHKDEQGNYIPLDKKSIDTGMGMERVLALLQGVGSIFETDVGRPIVQEVERLSGRTYGDDPRADIAMRVITDHARAVTFMVGDGILPSNEGRGYVLRRLLRRAVRFGQLLGLDEVFMPSVVSVVIDIMSDAYPEIRESRDYILKVVRIEEERFRERLRQGTEMLEDLIRDLKASGSTVIPGDQAFKLYDTYGFPYELTEEIARESGFTVDRKGFEEALERQRERARAARQENRYLDEVSAFYKAAVGDVESKFVGYDTLETEATVLAVLNEAGPVDVLKAGESGELVLDVTPFYGASGGQVGDTGVILGTGGSELAAVVVDTARPMANLNVAKVKVESGKVSKGDRVRAIVDREARIATARNHTATHLLHKALRNVLGEHVHQAGSLVTPSRLRFDFTHYAAMTPEEVAEVEAEVNRKAMEAIQVDVNYMSLDEARAMGAMALFDEKYGSEVRVVSIGDYSAELCGGTHLRNTGQMGLFKILSESGVAAGVRRIEAVTGTGVLDYLAHTERLLGAAASQLKAPMEDLPEKVARLVAEVRELNKEIESLKAKQAASQLDDILASATEVGGVRTITYGLKGLDAAGLRNLADQIKDKLGSGVVVLGSETGGKALFVAVVTEDLISRGLHAGNLVKEAAAAAGGGGGGRPDMAQAGGKDGSKVSEALAKVRDVLKSMLG